MHALRASSCSRRVLILDATLRGKRLNFAVIVARRILVFVLLLLLLLSYLR